MKKMAVSNGKQNSVRAFKKFVSKKLVAKPANLAAIEDGENAAKKISSIIKRRVLNKISSSKTRLDAVVTLHEGSLVRIGNDGSKTALQRTNLVKGDLIVKVSRKEFKYAPSPKAT